MFEVNGPWRCQAARVRLTEVLRAIACNELKPCRYDRGFLMQLDAWSIRGKQPWNHEVAEAHTRSKDRIEVEGPPIDAQRNLTDPPAFYGVKDAADELSIADLSTCQNCVSK